MTRAERLAWVALLISVGYVVRYCEDVWHLARDVRPAGHGTFRRRAHRS